MTGAAAPTLVLGMGNPILSDDSIGVRLARDLRGVFGRRRDVDFFVECSVGGLNLLDHLEGYRRVVVLDAIHTRGGVPGAVYRFDARGLRHTAHLCNVHDANFATALGLGRELGMDLPRDEDIHVFAVEILDDRTFGGDLTPPLADAYPDCLATVRRGVAELLAELLAELPAELPAAPPNAPDRPEPEERHGTDHRVEGPPVGAHPTADAG